MVYKMVPHFWVGDFETELLNRFGHEFMKKVDDLRMFLFDDRYMNDVSVDYHIDELEVYEGHEWQDPERIELENAIKLFLREMFPGHSYVLIDVMW